jgi:hypothetical protein
MAVYSNRAFIDPGDPAVVLGGPDVTSTNPANHPGVSGVDVDPIYAYVVFDAALLGPEMATAGGGTWDVTFEFRPSGYPTSAASTVSVTHSEGALTGLTGTYFTVSTTLAAASPALSGPDSYTLVVVVEDSQGDLVELLRTVTFRKS